MTATVTLLEEGWGWDILLIGNSYLDIVFTRQRIKATDNKASRIHVSGNYFEVLLSFFSKSLQRGIHVDHNCIDWLVRVNPRK